MLRNRADLSLASRPGSSPGEGVELDDLFVDPNWRRRVIANPHALALYRQLGFVDVGETNTEFGTAPRMALQVQ